MTLLEYITILVYENIKFKSIDFDKMSYNVLRAFKILTYFIYFEKDRNLFENATAPVFNLLVLHCKLHNRYVPSSSSFDAPKCLFWHWRYLSEKMGVYLILLRYRNAIIVSFQWRRDWFFCGFVMQLITLQSLPLMYHFFLLKPFQRGIPKFLIYFIQFTHQ